MAVIKKDYMDIILENVSNKFSHYIEAIKEMMEEGNDAVTRAYLRQIAPCVHHYYVLADETRHESVKLDILKQRHRKIWNEICDMDRELDSLAVKNGFSMGMFDAMNNR